MRHLQSHRRDQRVRYISSSSLLIAIHSGLKSQQKSTGCVWAASGRHRRDNGERREDPTAARLPRPPSWPRPGGGSGSHPIDLANMEVTGAIGSLLPKLGELLKDEYGLQKGVRKKIESLTRELEDAHAVLRKIGDVPPEQLDELVRHWARDVREASYDMEDIVDTFLVRVDDGPDPEPADPHMFRHLRKKVGGFLKKSKARRKISSSIQDIYKKLKDAEERRGRYKVDVPKPVPATTIDPRIHNLFKRVTDLVGIDGPRDELINMLSLGGDADVSDKMKVVSVVGSGGLGKTTLAKAVYDHLKLHFVCRASVPVDHNNTDMNKAVDDHLKPHFECGAFVVVGRNPDMKKVFRDILIDLDKEKYRDYSKMMVLDVKPLMEELNQFVKEKRCFIVIDDIWSRESWELIRSALQGSNCGCRVVVTTRIFEVAAYAGEEYKIQALSHENSEKLLYARIADGEGKYFDSPSPEACDKILKKCGGVPLAIITIASLLANKPGEDWSEVCNSIGFGHEDNYDVGNTRKILSFSYYDLPSHLKACLLYLSVFPEDHVIKKNNLIWKWKAEGFIHEDREAGIGSFELGETYFNELINRSMIKPEETKYEGYVDACSVHDMVLDLIHSLSSIENFVTVLDGNDERQKLRGSIVRRLALQNVEVPDGKLANIAVDKVRSLIARGCQFGSPYPRLPVLRVLDMVNCNVEEDCEKGMLDHLGSFLGSLLHLRYLGLVHSAGVPELPREVGYLKFLQTLDLRRSVVEELPEMVGLLTQLVCLQLNWVFSVPPGLIANLSSLQELCIRYLGDVGMQFVKDIGMLSALRVLQIIKIAITSESMKRTLLESLGKLHNIRTMHIGCAVPDCGTSYEGFVSCRRPLQYLCLKPFVFFGLPASIKSSLAPNLSYLDLNVLVLKEQDMDTLARLPELCCLILRARDTNLVSIKIINGGYFRKLRILRIFGPSVWFDLCGCKCNGSVTSTTIMPSLESLQFAVHVRSVKDTTLGFEKLFGCLGRTSLQRVTVQVKCGGARLSEVEEVETVLMHASAVHPKHPRLQTTWLQADDMLTPYKEVCMDVDRAPELVNEAWKLANIVGSENIRALRTPDPAASSSKVIRLLYTHHGMGLMALSSNAVHKLWKWERKSNTSVPPLWWQPENGIPMTNDTTDGNPEEATACNALSKNASYLISASGGKISLFNMTTFKVMTTFMAPPPAATFLAFNPKDNNIIAIGSEDSSIQIYNVRIDEVKMVLMGHQNKITGLAFSQLMGVLVSSGADAQLCAWSTDSWEKKKSRYIQPPSNASGDLVGDTMVQFHYDQTHLLVVHENQLAIYNEKLEYFCSWSPRDALPSLISSAVYSSDGLLVYAGFCDGAIGIFEAECLRLKCRIAPSAYIPSSISSCSGNVVYPMAVAANPWKPYQIAVGMSDGAVHVLEPPLDTDVEVGSKTSSGERPPGDISSSSSGDSQANRVSDRPAR